MIPLRGDIYECKHCGLRVAVLNGSHSAQLSDEPFRCSCGEEFDLLQSGSESVAEVPINKIIHAEDREHVHAGW